MEYCSVQEKAQEWNMSKRRIQVLCKEGRIHGAKMMGNMWLLPTNMAKPYDARKKDPIHTAKKEESGASRQHLKILLKIMYDFLEKNGIKKEKQRSYVLSALAARLIDISFAQSPIQEHNLEKYYKTIFKELSPAEPFDEKCMKLLELSQEFVLDKLSVDELDNLISWAYQYSNKIQDGNIYCNTQFFTEDYMVNFLLGNMEKIKTANKIVDPCCGGGNFLVHCIEVISGDIECKSFETRLLDAVSRIYGYDIDSNIVRVAAVNIKLKVLSLLAKHNVLNDFSVWHKINLNLYYSSSVNYYGSLACKKKTVTVTSLSNNKKSTMLNAIGSADIVITNPPFETVKGMNDALKGFLKQYYPLANCDVCVAFLYAIYDILNSTGSCGIVTQNSWMFLKTFDNMRADFLSKYHINKILNLGSGAFRDLSGEKSNVALMIIEKAHQTSPVKNSLYADFSKLSIAEKMQQIETYNSIATIFRQNDFKNGSGGFDFTSTDELKNVCRNSQSYAEIATPMQGTSTGNAKELIDFFWNHFGDPDWKLVSKGGGYCRWQGLNNCVVKWGENGEYIRAQKGSALRNTGHFNDTDMVFSDTGTAGLNVRTLLNQQIFVASGPGIRVSSGNAYAQLSFLNSRIATYFIRILSPKLTIAAGYIGQLPIVEDIYNSIVLEKNAKLCIELKKQYLCRRPVNYEYTYISPIPGKRTLEDCAWEMFVSDLKNELLKLEIEYQNDLYILNAFHLDALTVKQLDASVGTCAYAISDRAQIDYKKLDLYMDKLLDDCCALKRSRSSRMSIGNDGILEYTSKEFSINPEFLVREIIDHKLYFKNVISRYGNLILHNEILNGMGYTTVTGVIEEQKDIDEISSHLSEMFTDTADWKKWIFENFQRLHQSIFKNSALVEIKKNKLIAR